MVNLNKIKTTQELNEQYFLALSVTRGSLSMLKTSFFGVFLSLICLYPSYIIEKTVNQSNPWVIPINLLLVSILIFMSILAFITLTTDISYKYQKVFSILLVIYILLLANILVYLGYIISVYTETNLNWNSNSSNLFIMTVIIMWLVTISYNIHWLQKNLKHGFSENRAKLNYKAKASVYNSKTLWIIFGLTFLGGIVTQKINFIFGLGLAILMIVAFSRLIIELAYLAFLKIKDKKYWELVPEKEELTNKEKQIKYKKIFKWVNVSLSILFLCIIPQIIEKYHILGKLNIVLTTVFWLSLLNLIIIMLIKLVSKIRNKWFK
ncbi:MULTISPECIES: hypothetical protein [unclassified Enterococcus]|uniref:hypothetical protein n=1 Tax=unclassified Enterococcus TaxID=2608891 RepID=UPI0015537058|nr:MULTISPECIES: hypothetical protein [unclassified Enterococcus]MBS7576312.1 hypothetical protein [Enterococcus sp. MMGLQ5-2]MBS7583545.1 hypothetical protein [Enterococcus sp. MMGLQ5-1]NPD11407.1 hypothetical protein [Enterococcus sp. MMGLQ5-1]NPD36150.1 hypothetical protein [Enterococcus sp. MMGLQ5-2]